MNLWVKTRAVWKFWVPLSLVLIHATTAVAVEFQRPIASVAKAILLPHLEETHVGEASVEIEGSTIPSRVKSLVRRGEHEKVSLWALQESGWGKSSVSARITRSKDRFTGLTVRPLRKDELSLLSPVIDADMVWLSVDGLILGRSLEKDLGALTSGINLAKSYGLTQTGRKSARSMSMPVLEEWLSSSPPPSSTSTATSFALALLTGALTTLLIQMVKIPSYFNIGGRYATIAICSGLATLSAWLTVFLIPLYTLWLPQTTLLLVLASSTLAIYNVFRTGVPFMLSRGGGRSSRPAQACLSSNLLLPAIFALAFSSSTLIIIVSPMNLGDLWLPAIGYSIPFLAAPVFRALNPLKTNRIYLLEFVSVFLIITWGLTSICFSVFVPFLVSSHLSPDEKELPFELFFSMEFILPALVFLAVLLAVSLPRVISCFMEESVVKFEAFQKRLSHFGLLDILVAAGCIVFSLLASTPSLIKGQSSQNEGTANIATWTEAVTAVQENKAVIVDARPPGTLPEIPAFANLDPDSDLESLRNFCSFAEGKKAYIFCASSTCGISKDLASRMNLVCPGQAYYIEGGAEKWPTK